MDAVARRWRDAGGEVVAPREATKEQLARVHDATYIQRISETAGQAVALDPDTYTSPESYEIALLAAGAAVDAVERAMGGAHTTAFATRAASRPSRRARPGDGLLPVQQRRRRRGACARRAAPARVAIVDFDVHHGNGTQHIFERDPDDPVRLDAPVSLSTRAPARPTRSARRRRGLHGQPAARVRRDGRGLPASSSMKWSCRCCSSSSRTFCWCRRASTRTNAIRWRHASDGERFWVHDCVPQRRGGRVLRRTDGARHRRWLRPPGAGGLDSIGGGGAVGTLSRLLPQQSRVASRISGLAPVTMSRGRARRHPVKRAIAPFWKGKIAA